MDAACGYPNADTKTDRAVDIIPHPNGDQWAVEWPESVYSSVEDGPLDPNTVLPEDRQADSPESDSTAASDRATTLASQAASRPVIIVKGEPQPLGPDLNNFVLVDEQAATDLGFWPDSQSTIEPPSPPVRVQ